MTITRFPHGVSSFGVPVIPGIECGVGLGEIFWLVQAKTSSNLWYEKIRQFANDENILTSLTDANTNCTSGQSDTVFVTPGLYTTTVETDWTKSHCNVISTGGPNNLMAAAATIASRDASSVTIYTATSAVPSTFHVSGHRNNFYGLSFVNGGAAATNLQAVRLCGGSDKIGSEGNYFSRCTFHGAMSTSQNTIANCSVNIGSGSSNYMFEDCIIGQNTFGGDRRIAYSGHLYYPGVYETGAYGGAGAGPQNGIFRRCIFLSRSTSSYLTPVMVKIGASADPTGDESMDRVHWFIDCHFDSWGALGTAITSVFDDSCLSIHNVRLIDCSAHCYAEWRVARVSQNPETVFQFSSNMGIPVAADPGIGIEPTS